MKKRNKKMILVGLLTGVLFLAGCAKTEKNVSKGYSDSTKDSAVCFEEQETRRILYNQMKNKSEKNMMIS